MRERRTKPTLNKKQVRERRARPRLNKTYDQTSIECSIVEAYSHASLVNVETLLGGMDGRMAGWTAHISVAWVHSFGKTWGRYLCELPWHTMLFRPIAEPLQLQTHPAQNSQTCLRSIVSRMVLGCSQASCSMIYGSAVAGQLVSDQSITA